MRAIAKRTKVILRQVFYTYSFSQNSVHNKQNRQQITFLLTFNISLIQQIAMITTFYLKKHIGNRHQICRIYMSYRANTFRRSCSPNLFHIPLNNVKCHVPRVMIPTGKEHYIWYDINIHVIKVSLWYGIYICDFLFRGCFHLIQSNLVSY